MKEHFCMKYDDSDVFIYCDMSECLTCEWFDYHSAIMSEVYDNYYDDCL